MQDKTESLIRKAENFYRRGAFERTEKICRRILKTEADNCRVLTLLGNAYFCRRDYPGAMFCYQKIEKLCPDYVVNLINLANVCFEEKQYSQAKGYAERALLAEPENAAALSLLGNALLNMKNYDEAITILTRLLKLCPLDFWAANSLSQAWQKKNNWDEAFAAGWQAVEQSGGEEAQQINFGYLLYESTLEKQDSLLREYALKWLEKYPDNQVAQHMGNAVLNRAVRPRANDEYLKNIFDIFAPDFEQVLTGLDYRAPELIRCLLEEIYGSKKSPRLRILDAGCGTGFCGGFLKKYSSFRGLYGVDISEKMLEQAQAKKVYSHLLQSELEQYFSQAKTKFDLIVSADVFTYFGSLEKLLSGMADSLSAGGRVIFTVSENNLNDDDYFLHSSGRYLHHQNYVGKVLEKAGFEVEKLERAKLRNEGENIVYGYVVSALKK